MLSTRNILACMGKTGTASVLRDIFGFAWAPANLSLRRQLQLMKGPHLHMNFIVVGTFTQTEWNFTYQAVQIARDIYAKVSLGIGRIEWYSIVGSGVLDKDDAADLTSDYTVPNDSHDVFVVREMMGADGMSEVSGSCDKNSKGMSGSVVSLNVNAGPANAGNTFAHEVGHYLGLKHNDDPPMNFIASNSNSSQVILAWQGDKMKQHCWVRVACPD